MTVYFKELISISKMFQELFITAKVLVLYKRSYWASFLSFVGNRSVTKFSLVLLVNKVQVVFRDLMKSSGTNRNRLLPYISYIGM